jgi:hypothetical protein
MRVHREAMGWWPIASTSRIHSCTATIILPLDRWSAAGQGRRGGCRHGGHPGSLAAMTSTGWITGGCSSNPGLGPSGRRRPGPRGVPAGRCRGRRRRCRTPMVQAGSRTTRSLPVPLRPAAARPQGGRSARPRSPVGQQWIKQPHGDHPRSPFVGVRPEAQTAIGASYCGFGCRRPAARPRTWRQAETAGGTGHQRCGRTSRRSRAGALWSGRGSVPGRIGPYDAVCSPGSAATAARPPGKRELSVSPFAWRGENACQVPGTAANPPDMVRVVRREVGSACPLWLTIAAGGARRCRSSL